MIVASNRYPSWNWRCLRDHQRRDRRRLASSCSSDSHGWRSGGCASRTTSPHRCHTAFLPSYAVRHVLGKGSSENKQHRVSHGGERDLKSKSTCGISGPQAKDSLGIIKSGRARWPSSRPYKNDIAGRSPLRLATFSLPTHREVVAAAFRISALGAPQKKPPAPVRSMLRVCIPRRRDYANQLIADAA